MNEKKSILDLAGPIAESTGVSKKMAETFLRSLMEIIEESLQKDGIAKVKNLGTFKLIAIEMRKSVNVQDGSEVIIPAHTKVTFTPDKVLKDEINKPYAHLETYVLKDDGPVDGPYIADDSDEDEMDEEINVTQSTTVGLVSQVPDMDVKQEEDNLPSDDTVAVPSQNNTQESVEENVQPSIDETEASGPVEDPQEVEQKSQEVDPTDEEKVTDCPTETTPQNEDEGVDSSETNHTEETKPEEVTEDENTTTQNTSDMNNENEQNLNENVEESTAKIEEPETPETEKKPKKKDENKKNKWWLWLLIALLLVLAALFGLRYFMDHQEQGINTEPTPTQSMDELIEVGESDPFFEEEETPEQGTEFERAMNGEPIDTSIPEEAEASSNDAVAESEPETVAPAVESSAEMKAFDRKLVDYMKQNHPELNFPEKVAVEKEYTVLPGSRMAQVSRNLYDGTFNYWVYLYYFNTDVLKTPDNVKPGMVLKVPALGPKFVDPKSAKCKALATEIQAALLK